MSAVPYVPQIRRYQDWLQAHRGLAFDDYQSLWEWSVRDLPAFWQSIWDYFELRSPTPHSMPKVFAANSARNRSAASSSGSTGAR